MAYIGYQPSQLATAPFAVNTFTGDGSTTTFTLSQAVPGANEAMVAVVVENVQQNPIDAYTIGGASNTSLIFSEAPASGVAIYVIHKGEGTYNLQPSTGSVTSASLDPVLRNFTVDTFTGNGSTTSYTLTDTPYSANSVIVTVDGILQTASTNYTVSGTTLSFGTDAPASGAAITVLHLGFSTGNKSVADGTITPTKISSGGPSWTTGGFVGIGISSPTVNLHVVNSANSNTATDNAAVLISSTNRNGYVQVDGSTTRSGSLIFSNTGTEVGRIVYENSTNAMIFGVNGVYTASEKMRIDSSGNLGVGTSTPSSPGGARNLVLASTGVSILKSQSSSTTTGSARLDLATGTSNSYSILSVTDNTANPYLQLSVGAGVNNNYYDGKTHIWRNQDASSERMRIDTSGNVGIGTNSPSTYGKFAVVGDGYFSGKLAVGGVTSPSVNLEVLNNIKAISTTTIPSIIVQSLQGAGYTPPQFQMYRIASNGITPNNQTIGEIRFDGGNTAAAYDNMGMISVTSGVNATGGAPSTMSFSVATSGANASERMRIDSTGAVGVSNSAPFQYGVSTGVGAELSVQSSNTTHAGVTIQAGLSRFWIGTPYNSNVLEIGGNGGSWPGDTTNAAGAKITINPNGVQTIKFAPTQSASSDANTLDDYEEGTFTPTYTSASGTFTTLTYAFQSGVYVKIGRVVYCHIDLATATVAIGTASSTLRIAGLPFAPTANTRVYAAQNNNWNSNNPNCGVTTTSSFIEVGYNNAVNNSFCSPSDLSTVAGTKNEFHADFVYYTAT